MNKKHERLARLKYFEGQIRNKFIFTIGGVIGIIASLYVLLNWQDKIKRAREYYGGEFTPILIILVVLGFLFAAFGIWQTIENIKERNELLGEQK